MALLAYFKKSNPLKATLPSPTGLSHYKCNLPVSRQHKCMTEELERTSASESARKSTKRGTYQKYTPKEKVEISSYTTMHSTIATIRHSKDRFPTTNGRDLTSHKSFTKKINIFANLECFTNFCATKIWSYTVMPVFISN